ncbi:larval cuticle protein A2B-like [Thrips palmi]|uniref:Larval cuticle protein A2B-like n=1 Tax=Thrips palmi TaxID=161013 RepID=A0A6P8YPV6_THRPL|nr:larval cuticle protein A2B-like [Thrips palmi]
MAAAGSWTLLWVACFAVAPGPTVAMLLRGPSSSSGSAEAQARLTVVDWNAYDDREQDGPGTYSFGYEIEDAATANTQFRQEERFANGTVVGSYGLVEPDGNVRVVNYVADAQGYR